MVYQHQVTQKFQHNCVSLFCSCIREFCINIRIFRQESSRGNIIIKKSITPLWCQKTQINIFLGPHGWFFQILAFEPICYHQNICIPVAQIRKRNSNTRKYALQTSDEECTQNVIALQFILEPTVSNNCLTLTNFGREQSCIILQLKEIVTKINLRKKTDRKHSVHIHVTWLASWTSKHKMARYKTSSIYVLDIQRYPEQKDLCNAVKQTFFGQVVPRRRQL